MSLLHQFWEAVKQEETKIAHQLRHLHRRHRFHRGFLLASFLIVLLLFGTLSGIYLQTTGAAEPIMFSLEIVDSSTTTKLSGGQSQSGGVSPSGSGAVESVPTSPILTSPGRETVSSPRTFRIALILSRGAEHPQGTVTDQSGQSQIPVIDDNTPTFRGTVDLPFAVLLLELHSLPEEAITSTIRTDEQGNWEFTAPRPISEGPHILYITIFDANSEIKLGEAVLHFIVDTFSRSLFPSPSIPVGEVSTPPPSFFERGRLLFDVQAAIPHSYETISPGQDLLLELKLTNLSRGGQLEDVTIIYEIKNEQGEVILKQSETLGVALQETYVRLFRTAHRLAPGKYTLLVSLPYPDGRVDAISSIDFEVQGEPVLSFATGAKVNLNLVFQALGLLLTIFSLIAYYEFKQVQGLARVIHQITEKDLLAKGLIHHP